MRRNQIGPSDTFNGPGGRQAGHGAYQELDEGQRQGVGPGRHPADQVNMGGPQQRTHQYQKIPERNRQIRFNAEQIKPAGGHQRAQPGAGMGVLAP